MWMNKGSVSEASEGIERLDDSDTLLYNMLSLFWINEMVQHLKRIFYKFVFHHLR